MGADKADVIKHLEMLQGVINRMAANSFVVKGWSVTLAAALAALGAQSANQWFVAFGLIPVIAFWGLDAYYLEKERSFRKLYDAVRKPFADPAAQPVPLFSMNIGPYEGGFHAWWKTLWSTSVAWVHGVIAVVLIIVLALVVIY